MKTKLLLVLFLFVSTFVCAHGNKQEVEAQFTSYLNSIVDKDFEKAMSYAPDELFKVIPKEQMIEMMEKAFNDPKMEIKVKDPKIISIGNSEEVEGKYYALLKYSNVIAMRFDNSDAKTEEEKQMRIEITKQMFAKPIAEGKAEYNEETEFFDFYSEKEVYAISKDGKTNWKFVVVEKSQKELLDEILPKKVMKKIDFSKS